MSELANVRFTGSSRRRLLSTVSAMALLTSVGLHKAAAASEDSDHPTVWIELGGQLERIDGTGDRFLPQFLFFEPTSASYLPSSPHTPIVAQTQPRYGIGGEGKISFAPQGTNWILSVTIRYGRSNSKKFAKQQTALPSLHYTNGLSTIERTRVFYDHQFAKTDVKLAESHAIFDFQAGKDVGLGMFGREGTSVLGAGIRFAQFTANTSVDVKLRQNFEVFDGNPGPKYLPNLHFHAYTAIGNSERSFRGIGPSLSWSASAPFAGNSDDTAIALDWGLNGAVLFGRQKVRASHQTADRYYIPGYIPPPPKTQFSHYRTYLTGNSAARSRSVVVPNVGGFVGISLRRSAAKVSFGYRGDIFFGAVDGGWDARRNLNLSFYGPFANISIGLGE